MYYFLTSNGAHILFVEIPVCGRGHATPAFASLASGNSGPRWDISTGIVGKRWPQEKFYRQRSNHQRSTQAGELSFEK
jgi:hypothetical protein